MFLSPGLIDYFSHGGYRLVHEGRKTMTSNAAGPMGNSIRFGVIEVSLLAAIAISLTALGLAGAGDKPQDGKKRADMQKTATTRTSAPAKSPSQKVATQKLMRNPWERTPAKVAPSRSDMGDAEAPYHYW